MKEPENKYDDQGRKTGLWKEYDSVGNGFIVNSYKAGVLNGKCKYYYNNELRTIYFVRDGILHGPRLNYLSTLGVNQITNYVNGRLFGLLAIKNNCRVNMSKQHRHIGLAYDYNS